MKNFKRFIAENEHYCDLINAVRNQLGVFDDEEFFRILDEVVTYGSDRGFPGFIYYSECKKFFIIYRDEIIEMFKENFENFGYESVLQYFAQTYSLQYYDFFDLAKAFYSPVESDDDEIFWLISCIVLEFVANLAENLCDEDEE